MIALFRKTSVCLAVGLLLASAVSPTQSNVPAIRAVSTIVRTRYCSGDADLFSVLFKLRVHYINQTKETLILDKGIGKAWFQVKVAQDLRDLNAGKYEYSPNTDWFFSDKDNLPAKPQTGSPNSEFVVLAPNQEFEGEINTGIFVQFEKPKDVAGSIRAGTHVMQIELSTWNHAGEASIYSKAWQKFGKLIAGTIHTEPLEIHVPSNPKLEDRCN